MTEGGATGPANAAGRPRRRTALWALAAVAAVVLVAAGVLGGTWLVGRAQAARKLDAAAVLIERADVAVVAVDAVVRAPIEPALAGIAQSAQSKVPRARQQLDEALVYLDEADKKTASSDRERATLLRRAAQARATMLDEGAALLDADFEAATALPSAVSGWERAVSGSSLSDQAVSSYNKLTRASVVESRNLNTRAKAEFTAAMADFSAAEESFPEGPFERYVEYVDARLALLELSLRADTAWLDGDAAGANRIIKKYNTRDKEAVDLAKTLPATPQAAIAETYEQVTKSAMDAFFAARDRALKADEAMKVLEGR